jgi:hypothetical protein
MYDDLQEGRKDREKQQQKPMKKEKDLQPSK